MGAEWSFPLASLSDEVRITRRKDFAKDFTLPEEPETETESVSSSIFLLIQNNNDDKQAWRGVVMCDQEAGMVTDGSHPAAKRGFPAHVSPAPRDSTGDAETPAGLNVVSGADPRAGGWSAGLGAGAGGRRASARA